MSETEKVEIKQRERQRQRERFRDGIFRASVVEADYNASLLKSLWDQRMAEEKTRSEKTRNSKTFMKRGKHEPHPQCRLRDGK